MTRTNKVNKRSVKKSTPVAETSTPVAVSFIPEVTPNLDNLSYRELQLLAKGAGLKANGSTADLMARLA